MLLFYEIMFAVSLILLAVYVFMWHRHFDMNMTFLFALIPFANAGYLLMERAQNLDEAFAANSLIYVGGCFLALFIMQNIFTFCDIKIGKYVRTALFAITTAIFLSVVSTRSNPYFYKSISFVTDENGHGRLVKEYGFIHTLFNIMTVVYVFLSVAAIAYSYLKKKNVSKHIIRLLLFPELLSFVTFFSEKFQDNAGIELMPLTYVLAQVIYLVIIHRTCLYDIDETVTDSLVQTGDTGFISFDFKFRYIGSNSTAKEIFPALNDLSIDSYVGDSAELKDNFLNWLTAFRDDPDKNEMIYSSGGKTYIISVRDLYDGIRKRGWYLFIRDDTAKQEYIRLVENYNTDLLTKIDEKTRNIVEMHDRLIMSMATMVESRDNSTGGHIRRTSRVVSILIGEIMKENKLGLSQEFCRNIIKAAPMHDLGKIAVDDAVLRKPGKFTDEEYEIMKTHAAEGARIVHEILSGTEDRYFAEIAENVAHYHHERWDGSGYPEGLKGEEIPLEARIMAVADVYDALVSRRVYKDKMSFEKADSIIMDGMGKHFDKRLEEYYIKARPMLEAFYKMLEMSAE